MGAPAGSGPAPAGREPVRLTGESATLFLPLWAKALDYRSPHPILNDPTADEIVRRVDYDLGWARDFSRARILAVRARHLDEWVREFLAAHPTATVLHLGCGLDGRIRRIGPTSAVAWFDVDFPEVIELRRRFFTERPGYSMVGSPLTDPGWLEKVPADRPALAVADGVFEYLAREEVAGILGRITGRFGHGQVLFDTMSSRVVNAANRRLRRSTGARVRWAVDSPTELDGLVPGLVRIDTASVLRSRFLPRRERWLFAPVRLVPGWAAAIRLIRMSF